MSKDRVPETCPRCGGWVWHRREPCACEADVAKKKTAPDREQINVRLSPDEAALIRQLAADLSREYGFVVTVSDVVRKAVRALAEKVFGNNSENP